MSPMAPRYQAMQAATMSRAALAFSAAAVMGPAATVRAFACGVAVARSGYSCLGLTVVMVRCHAGSQPRHSPLALPGNKYRVLCRAFWPCAYNHHRVHDAATNVVLRRARGP